MSSNSKLIFDSYCTLTGACPLYQQSWMCDETIFRILNTHYPHLKNAFNFTREGLNRSISAKAGPCTGQNPYGIYWATFSTDCPYSGVFRKVSYYFRQDTKNNQPPDDPVSASDIVDKLASCNQLRRDCIRLGSNMPNVEGDDVHKGVQDIITSLTRAQQSHDGYKHFVANIDQAPLTPIQIFRLKSQCLYLRTAYQIALKKLGRGNNTWIETCCGGAVRKLSPLGFNATADNLRLGRWNRLFRRDHMFPHPNTYVSNGMKPKPRIFEVFPEAEAMISDVVLGHLDHFSVAMLRNELITIIIPGLKQKAEDESVPVDSEEYLLLSHLSAQPPSYSTVLRWLHYLGYTHDKLKKSYYVDGHEHQEQKLHQSKFIKKYFEVEIQTHRWVQMSIVEFEEAQSSLSDDGNDKIINPGYSYTHPVTGDPWIEFHVDDINMKLIGDNVGPFGGNVSVRCPAGSRPLIIFGQDESIFNQFSHSGRQWLGPLGQRSIMPKSAGMGVMLSAFQSRDVSARIFDCYFHILIALNHLMFIVVRHSLAGVYK